MAIGRKHSDACAWIVVFASLLLQILGLGGSYAFGVLLLALNEEGSGIESALSTISLIGSFQTFCLYFTAIFAGRAIKIVGYRCTAISGSVMSGIGVFAAGLSPNIHVLYLTYGLINGVGCGFVYLSSLVAVQKNFDKNRNLAASISSTGVGLGMFAFPFMTQALLDGFNWRTTLMIEAGVMLSGVLAGALLFSAPVIEEKEPELRSVETKELKELKKEEYSPITAKLEVEEEKNNNARNSERVFTVKYFYFALFVTKMSLWSGLYLVVCTYLPQRAIDSGMRTHQADFLLSIIGITNVLSRVVFGFIGNNSDQVRIVLMWISSGCFGISSCCTSLLSTFPHFCVYSTLCGLTLGCTISVYPTIAVDILGIEVVELALGILLSCCSVVLLSAPPLAGIMIEKSGSTDMPFYIYGGICTIGAFMLLPIIFSEQLKKCPCVCPIQSKNHY